LFLGCFTDCRKQAFRKCYFDAEAAFEADAKELEPLKGNAAKVGLWLDV